MTMRNSSIKKYIPVYQRDCEIEVWRHRKEDFVSIIYGANDGLVCSAIASRKSKLGYTVQRLRSRRAGQQELFPILTGKPSKKRRKGVRQ